MGRERQEMLGLRPEQKDLVEQVAVELASQKGEPVHRNDAVEHVCRDFLEAEA